jgi:hypothetical protein
MSEGGAVDAAELDVKAGEATVELFLVRGDCLFGGHRFEDEGGVCAELPLDPLSEGEFLVLAKVFCGLHHHSSLCSFTLVSAVARCSPVLEGRRKSLCCRSADGSG